MESQEYITIDDYLNSLSCASINELTTAQLFEWAKKSMPHFERSEMVFKTIYSTRPKAQEKIIELLKQSISTNKEFYLPSLIGADDSTPTYFCYIGNDMFSLDEYVNLYAKQ